MHLHPQGRSKHVPFLVNQAPRAGGERVNSVEGAWQANLWSRSGLSGVSAGYSAVTTAFFPGLSSGTSTSICSGLKPSWNTSFTCFHFLVPVFFTSQPLLNCTHTALDRLQKHHHTHRLSNGHTAVVRVAHIREKACPKVPAKHTATPHMALPQVCLLSMASYKQLRPFLPCTGQPTIPLLLALCKLLQLPPLLLSLLPLLPFLHALPQLLTRHDHLTALPLPLPLPLPGSFSPSLTGWLTRVEETTPCSWTQDKA